MDLTRQLEIVHLSDLHFGDMHQFNPPRSAAGDCPEEGSYPLLVTKLAEDFANDEVHCPVIVCITGDLAQTASLREFTLAEQFISHLSDATIFGKKLGPNSIFLVPGNHDVQYDSPDISARWQQWTDFSNRIHKESILREYPWGFARVHDRIDDLGVVIACLNSAIYVEKNKHDELRGRLDVKQLEKIRTDLENIDRKRLNSSIRVAIVHHHPILVPALVEAGRGYDAIHCSGQLLALLHDYGFHLVLHGHKHNPHTFSHDVDSAYESLSQPTIIIAAGGSAGSTELPQMPRAQNTYNRVKVKWHPPAGQTRIRIETRGLNLFNERGRKDLPTRWHWESLKVYDRSFLRGRHAPNQVVSSYRKFNLEKDSQMDSARIAEYERTRGNLAVTEVMPSLIPGQAYEARLWVEHHGDPKLEDMPIRVTWTAGKKFPVVAIEREKDPLFCAVYNYWGPMLVQASMTFADGAVENTHVYARMPKDYSSKGIN